ncbi:MAG TPA: AMP-binding protein [Rubrivivax sp.]|nr:AMP-binding protein [Rubrivivax sp.]
MATDKLILDYVYEHEASQPERIYLTQPIGGGRVIDYSWAQVLDQSRRMAAHLQSRGLGRGDQIAILSKNCAHFFMAELAIWMAGGTTVAIYPTELAETVRYVLVHSESKLLFVGKLDTWEQQAAGVPEVLPRIAFPLAPPTPYDRWDDIVARHEPLPGRPARAPNGLAMIAYTSGSTGQPKGVMHNFEGVTRATEGIVARMEQTYGDLPEHRMLSYLPLAHVFERAFVECATLVSGKTQVFFAESLDTFLADLQRARPTGFISVPRLWLRFQQGVFAKMPPKKLDRLLSIPILRRIVARKILAGLGLDHVVLAGSGSAPLPPELLTWYRKLGLNLMEGYAMSEDFAYSHTSTKEKNLPGYVGVAYPEVQVRISPEGEVLIKSPGRLVGYFKRPDLDAECFTEDGFFRTGDMGELRDDGLLKITGRVKELFKTGKGKYVAPAPIENRLNAHPMVESAIVSGVGQQAAYGMLVLAEALRPRLQDAVVCAQVEQAMAALLKEVNAQLAGHEKLHMLVVAKEPWSIENGCLTPTMKIKRSRIEGAVADRVEAWYAAPGPVVWA